MAKRFISPDWKKLRSLPGYLQRAWFYIWDKADACGVYHFDEDYIKLDLKLSEQITLKDLARLPDCKILPRDRILIENFLVVNYGHLRPDYNPHKAAYRDIAKNNLSLNSSLTQACPKHEEEGEDKEEEIDEGKGEEGGGMGEEKFLVPAMCQRWYNIFPYYTRDKNSDYHGMLKVIDFIRRQAGVTDLKGVEVQEKMLNTLTVIGEVIISEPFWVNKPLKSIANNIQEFYNKIKNPVNGKEGKSDSKQSIRDQAAAIRNERRANRQQAGNKSGP